MRLTKTLEKIVTTSPEKAWTAMQLVNGLLPHAAPFLPKWSDRPIPSRKKRTKPTLGWPRTTDSLCPTCVKEARAEILRGDADWMRLLSDKPGEIKAHIVERDGHIYMEK